MHLLYISMGWDCLAAVTLQNIPAADALTAAISTAPHLQANIRLLHPVQVLSPHVVIKLVLHVVVVVVVSLN
jgi:hypothetical protein